MFAIKKLGKVSQKRAKYYMQFRLGNPRDTGRLACLHLQSSKKQPGGFMYHLGKGWLKAYYRILLTKGNLIVLCAEEDGQIMGFVSGTLDASKNMDALRHNKFSLLIAAIPAIICNPKILLESYRRQKANAGVGKDMYVLKDGVHEDYWAWNPARHSGAIDLHLKWLSLVKLLGANNVKGEVDMANKMILKTHQMLGAKLVRQFVTPDGRKRVIIEYQF